MASISLLFTQNQSDLYFRFSFNSLHYLSWNRWLSSSFSLKYSVYNPLHSFHSGVLIMQILILCLFWIDCLALPEAGESSSVHPISLFPKWAEWWKLWLLVNLKSHQDCFFFTSLSLPTSHFQVLRSHLLLFRLPQQHSELGFDTYDQLPPIRAKRLESVLKLQSSADAKGDWRGEYKWRIKMKTREDTEEDSLRLGGNRCRDEDVTEIDGWRRSETFVFRAREPTRHEK